MESESARCLNIIQPVVSLNAKEPNLPNILSLCQLPDSSKEHNYNIREPDFKQKAPPPPPPLPEKKAITKQQKKNKNKNKKTTKQENKKKPEWMG